MHRLLFFAAALSAACGDNSASVCEEIGGTRQAVLAEDRYILGLGDAYPADLMLRGRERELYRSQSERRAAAWATVAKVLAPVALAQELPNAPANSVPLWQTWFGSDDTTRLFRNLYEELSPEERSARAHFDDGAIDDALGFHEREVLGLENWPAERLEDYLAAIDDPEKLAGVGGIGPVSYSPSAMRTFLKSYPEMLSCLQEVPAPFDDTPGDAVQTAAREPIHLGACEARTFGPYYVGESESLTATLEGEGVGDADITLEAAGESTACQGDRTCAISATGPVLVRITSGTSELSDVALQVDYRAPNAPWAACLQAPFASDSVVVKASWHRAQFEQKLPVYDTSAEALRELLSSNAESGWGPGDREADPGPDAIYTAERPSGSRFRLAGLHIMSKELDHWQWITLWWSDSPDSDFGADRPQSIEALGGPWSNYKMCTVTMFDEGDGDPSGGFGDSAPSLAAALEAVHQGSGGPSWCSNPYIELGPGNMATNCIGCHQHAGDDLRSEDIIGDRENFPEFGRTQLRNNFPHDYSWAPAAGDELTLAFKAIVDFFE